MTKEDLIEMIKKSEVPSVYMYKFTDVLRNAIKSI